MLVYHDIDLHDYELKNVKIHVTGTTPSSEKGQIYLDTSDNILKWHDGTIWRALPTDFLSLGDNVSDLINDAGYLTSYTETDPIFIAHPSFGIGSIDISNWNVAHSWGNHALAGYLTSSAAETDTLDSVTTRGAVTSNNITVGSLVVSGNLTVSGSVTTINTEEINLADNIITLNSNATGAATENAGLLIERGSDANRGFRWNESSNTWQIQKDDNIYYDLATTDEFGNFYAETITDSATVTHGLNSNDIKVQMYDTITLRIYKTDWIRSTTNAIQVSFYETPTNPIRVLIEKNG